MAKFFTGLLLGDFESDVQQCKVCQGESDKDDDVDEVDEIDQIDQDGHLVPSAGIVEPAMEKETALATCECLEVEDVLVVVGMVMMLYITMQVVVPHAMMIIILVVGIRRPW